MLIMLKPYNTHVQLCWIYKNECQCEGGSHNTMIVLIMMFQLQCQTIANEIRFQKQGLGPYKIHPATPIELRYGFGRSLACMFHYYFNDSVTPIVCKQIIVCTVFNKGNGLYTADY